MRVEQLYPVPLKALVQELGRFKKRRSGVVPGRAAQHGRVALHRALSRMGAEPDQRAEQASALRRPRAAAATATGLMSKHLAQLKALLDEALN
jgi:2-oxoglutarate dehydrogenase E1 component